MAVNNSSLSPNLVIDRWFGEDFSDQPLRVIAIYLVAVAQVVWQGLPGLVSGEPGRISRKAEKQVRRCFPGVDPVTVGEATRVLNVLAGAFGPDFLLRTREVRERARIAARFSLSFDERELERARGICAAATRHLVVDSDANGLIVEEQRIRFPAPLPPLLARESGWRGR